MMILTAKEICTDSTISITDDSITISKVPLKLLNSASNNIINQGWVSKLLEIVSLIKLQHSQLFATTYFELRNSWRHIQCTSLKIKSGVWTPEFLGDVGNKHLQRYKSRERKEEHSVCCNESTRHLLLKWYPLCVFSIRHYLNKRGKENELSLAQFSI